MGRAERRKANRRDRIEERKNKILMSAKDIRDMKREITKEASNFNVEALMTCFALAEHRLYGYGQKRILRSLQYIDSLMGEILNGSATIEDYKKELEEKAQVKIQIDLK